MGHLSGLYSRWCVCAVGGRQAAAAHTRGLGPRHRACGGTETPCKTCARCMDTQKPHWCFAVLYSWILVPEKSTIVDICSDWKPGILEILEDHNF